MLASTSLYSIMCAHAAFFLVFEKFSEIFPGCGLFFILFLLSMCYNVKEKMQDGGNPHMVCQKEGSMKKRDASIELFRIIGALMVVGTHAKLPMVMDGQPDLLRILFACLVGDGVAVFWLVLGCFYFKSDYKTHLVRLLKRTIIPLFIVSVIWFFFMDWILGTKTFSESISHPLSDYKAVLKGILVWENRLPTMAGHFWYMYTYTVVILLFPILKGGRDQIGKYKNGPVVSMIAILLLLTVNDLTLNGLLEFTTHTILGAAAAFVFVLSGDVIYGNREKIQENGKIRILSALVFIFVLLIRIFVQYKCLFRNPPSEHPIFWYSAFSYLQVLSMMVFLLSFSEGLAKHEKIFKAIRHIGSRTFYIYIVHPALMNFRFMNRVRDGIYGTFGSSGFKGVLYELFWMLASFAVSYIISEIICQLIRIPSYLKNTRKEINRTLR